MIGRSLEKKIIGLIVVLLSLCFLTIGLLPIPWVTSRIHEEHMKKLSLLAESVVLHIKQDMLREEALVVESLIESFKSIKGIQQIDILKRNGEAAFRDISTIVQVNKRLGENLYQRPEKPKEKILLSDDPLLQQLFVTNKPVSLFKRNSETHILLYPLLNEENCHKCHGSAESVLGVVLISMSTVLDTAMINSIKLKLITAFLAIMFVMAFLLWLALKRIVTLPILQIAAKAKKIKEEGFPSQALEIHSNDEIGELARNFNQMTSTLRENYQKLKETEEQLRRSEKMAAVGVLASGVAHEVGNPLTSIFSLAQIIERKSKEPLTRRKISLMKTHIEQISKIIRDFLNFSKPTVSNFVNIDIQKAIESTICLSKYDKRVKKLNITTRIEDSLPKVYGSSEGFHQVFLNLTFNAADAVEDMGGGQLAISASATNGFVNISFSDNGRGINDEEKTKIFEPFYTTKKPGKGLGLGLFVSYGIIESFGGEIIVESEKGKGSSFNLRLPASNV